jgi:hypothetical protein
MSEQHQTLFYKTKESLKEKICEFFEEGIKEGTRCVYITSENDAIGIYEKLKERNERTKVVKLFSYYTVPDPVGDSEYFDKKVSKIRETLFDGKFQGRIAFNVLGDMTRFSVDVISKIETIEKHLEKVKGMHLKMMCSFQIGEGDKSRKAMLDMALKTHDGAMFEKDDGSYSQITLGKTQ